jgi:hypothetical protein
MLMEHIDISTLSAVLMACVLAVQGLTKLKSKQVVITCPNQIDGLSTVLKDLKKDVRELKKLHEEKATDGISRVECRLTPKITERLEDIEDIVKDVRRYQKNGNSK